MDEDKDKLAEEYLNGWKRAKADLINYKKDETKRLEDAIKFGNEFLIRDLITILDSFNLAISALEKTGAVDKGIYLIKSQLEDALKRHGLEKLVVSAGEPFNPATQEAITEVESSTMSPGQVVEEVEAGYTLNGKIIRPARVKVAK